MVAPDPLSEQDLEAARSALSAGRPFTVWFTSAAVGVPASGSAKVVSVADAAEGDFIQVRPAGSRDTMFCSPVELTTTRPARKRPRPPAASPDPVDRSAPVAERSAPPPARPAQPTPEQPRTATEQARPAALTPPGAAAPRAAAIGAAAPGSADIGAAAPGAPPASPPERPADRPRASAPRSPARPAEVTVTLNATAEGEWTVEVVIGKKRTVRPTPVQPAEVAKAARSLPSAVAEAIESSLEAARRRQLDRVERLRAELDAAQRALHELSG